MLRTPMLVRSLARLALAGGAAVALSAGAAPSARAGVACGVIDSPCTLSDIVTQALADAPGTEVVRAGTGEGKRADGSEVVLYVVVVRAADGSEEKLYYDTATCLRVLPPAIQVTFLEALGLAKAAAEAAAPGPAPAVVLKGTLRNEVLAPTYAFKILDPQQHAVLAKVDAVSGAVDLGSPMPSAFGKGNGKGKGLFVAGSRGRHGGRSVGASSPLHCDDVDSDDDSDSNDDVDSDLDSDDGSDD